MERTLAQITNPVLPSNLGSGGNAAGPVALGNLLGSLVGVFIIIAFVFTLLYLLLGGLDWISSGGDKTKLQSARDKITNALVGLIIVAASWAIMSLVGNFFNISFPHLPIPTLGE